MIRTILARSASWMGSGVKPDLLGSAAIIHPFTSVVGGRPVVLYDGVCNLCNGVVNFVIDHDSKHKVMFGALQSPQTRLLLRSFGLEHLATQMNSFVLIENRNVYLRSTAAMRLLGHLDPPVRYLSLLRVFPRVLRDAVYTLIASSRYRVFGKSQTCRMPTPALRQRFLESYEAVIPSAPPL
jgi:predicted DCC family thiol-disulfide oxidoreductase YuxK